MEHWKVKILVEKRELSYTNHYISFYFYKDMGSVNNETIPYKWKRFSSSWWEVSIAQPCRQDPLSLHQISSKGKPKVKLTLHSFYSNNFTQPEKVRTHIIFTFYSHIHLVFFTFYFSWRWMGEPKPICVCVCVRERERERVVVQRVGTTLWRFLW